LEPGHCAMAKVPNIDNTKRKVFIPGRATVRLFELDTIASGKSAVR